MTPSRGQNPWCASIDMTCNKSHSMVARVGQIPSVRRLALEVESCLNWPARVFIEGGCYKFESRGVARWCLASPWVAPKPSGHGALLKDRTDQGRQYCSPFRPRASKMQSFDWCTELRFDERTADEESCKTGFKDYVRHSKSISRCSSLWSPRVPYSYS